MEVGTILAIVAIIIIEILEEGTNSEPLKKDTPVTKKETGNVSVINGISPEVQNVSNAKY